VVYLEEVKDSYKSVEEDDKSPVPVKEEKPAGRSWNIFKRLTSSNSRDKLSNQDSKKSNDSKEEKKKSTSTGKKKKKVTKDAKTKKRKLKELEDLKIQSELMAEKLSLQQTIMMSNQAMQRPPVYGGAQAPP
jgi:hypothetical protein